MVRNASLEAQSNTPLLLSRLLLSRESGYHGYQSARENKGVAPKEPLERYYTDRLAREPEERERGLFRVWSAWLYRRLRRVQHGGSLSRPSNQ
jgi:hypothetical protein